jgi:hypothetical protein
MQSGAPASSPAGSRLAARVMAMWSPPDPYEPTSQIYRLMPPRRPDDDGDPFVVISPDLGRWRDLAARARPAVRWACGITGGVVTGVLVALISAWLLHR